MSEKATYTHGHHKSVVSHHARRTAQDSAGFLIPHIKPHFQILDIGCGPGTITVGLAKLVPDGSVIGGEIVADVLKQAQENADQEGVKNIKFETFDANALPYDDDTFDVTYCHQVLQHVGNPVAILKEMKRVTKKGGFVAARDADYQSFAFYPEDEGLLMWNDIYRKACKANGAEPNAGRYNKSWALQAGFEVEDVVFTWDCWNYQGEDAVAFSRSWKGRALHSNFATTVVQHGLGDQQTLERISKIWEDWGKQEGAFLIVPNGEILCQVN